MRIAPKPFIPDVAPPASPLPLKAEPPADRMAPAVAAKGPVSQALPANPDPKSAPADAPDQYASHLKALGADAAELRKTLTAFHATDDAWRAHKASDDDWRKAASTLQRALDAYQRDEARVSSDWKTFSDAGKGVGGLPGLAGAKQSASEIWSAWGKIRTELGDELTRTLSPPAALVITDVTVNGSDAGMRIESKGAVPLKADGAPSARFDPQKFTGPLVKDGVDPRDVVQGQQEDCFMAAALASMALWNKDALQHALVDHGDGTYSVFFYRHIGDAYVRDEVIVDADLWTRRVRDKTINMGSPGDTELWPALVEKAWVIWQAAQHNEFPSYDRLDKGGYAGDVFSAILGKPSETYEISDGKDTATKIAQGITDGRPMTLCMPDLPSPDTDYHRPDGLVWWHQYSVVGIDLDAGYVRVRNPWGSEEPQEGSPLFIKDGNGNDGIFKIPIDKLTEFASLQTVAP